MSSNITVTFYLSCHTLLMKKRKVHDLFTITTLVNGGVRIWTQVFLIILCSYSLLGLSGGNAFIQRNSQMEEIVDAMAR